MRGFARCWRGPSLCFLSLLAVQVHITGWPSGVHSGRLSFLVTRSNCGAAVTLRIVDDSDPAKFEPTSYSMRLT